MTTQRPFLNLKNIEVLISIITGLATFILAIIVYFQSQQIRELDDKVNQKRFFSDTLAKSIEHLSSESPKKQRIAVVTLVESAEDSEQIKETLKAIILATNSEKQQDSNSYQFLLKIAGLDLQKEQEIKKALTDPEVQKLIQLFPPLNPNTQTANIPPNQSPDKTINPSPPPIADSLESQTQQLINEQTEKVKDLVKKIYDHDKSTRQSSVNELSLDKYRAYDSIMVAEMLKQYQKSNQNYFGIVNTLFLLGKVDNQSLKNNLDSINQLVSSSDSLLTTSNKRDYLDPIKKKIENSPN
ncbi:hypothetical protein [Crocosphaera sp. XPORK-15E]|uniref:hypothetical protein n=1 Tax=Crocosphaera sp. XPORK-15E TaxID=3110247 RepID=UPI002B1EB661|nr:hypothetical protein [Crocosphaera sp. XPORK-15E]MEA5536845.1 hypothetical protein [Crocosphaera sp. XPORK-15E]